MKMISLWSGRSLAATFLPDRNSASPAGIARVETGPKGVILSFHNDQFRNPAGLAEFLSGKKVAAKLRPDHKLIIFMKWHDTADRLEGVLGLVQTFRRISEAA